MTVCTCQVEVLERLQAARQAVVAREADVDQLIDCGNDLAQLSGVERVNAQVRLVILRGGARVRSKRRSGYMALITVAVRQTGVCLEMIWCMDDCSLFVLSVELPSVIVLFLKNVSFCSWYSDVFHFHESAHLPTQNILSFDVSD